MSVKSLVLGGVEVPIHSIFEFSQDFEIIGAFTVLRMNDGGGVKESLWTKLKTRINGGGTIPLGLQSLDYNGSLLLKSGGVRSITSNTRFIQLPATRRNDIGYEPVGAALIGTEWVCVNLSIDGGGSATLDNTFGATMYRVDYYPEFMVFAAPPNESQDVNGKVFSWTLEAEQV